MNSNNENLKMNTIENRIVTSKDLKVDCTETDIIDYEQIPVIIRYHFENCPNLQKVEIIKQGDFVDLRAAENVTMKQFDFKLISLGVSIKLPKGYTAILVPRSSTYKNFGIIMANSIGIIDESYCGDGDIWRFAALAMRDTEIHVNDRIAQFTIIKKSKMRFFEVDKLSDPDRGGIGSTGIN